MSPTTTAGRKQSILRHKFSLRPSALRAYLDPSEKDSKRSSTDGKRESFEETSWIARKRRKNKRTVEEPKHQIDELKIDVGGFDDFKSSFDGGELYSLRSPEPIATTATNETSVTAKPESKEESVQKPIAANAPHATELEDTSGTATQPAKAIAIHEDAPETVTEVRKGPKYQIKLDTLVRPVSSGRASALSANVSSTIAAINKNSFHSNGKWSAHVDSMASARPSVDSNRSKFTNNTDKVDSVLGSNASTTSRQPLGDSNRATNVANRHSVGDMDKLIKSQADQENKRQSFPPEAARRQSLVNMRSAALRPKSPTNSISSTTSAMPRPRRPSGTFAASRLAWIQDLEANNGSKTPGQEYMLRKLEGGVADKLRRFESQSSQATGSSSRSQSTTRGANSYGIETKRLSRTVTADDDFRRKLEEQFQKKQAEDEEREKKKQQRASLKTNTPQQIIDYVELNDKDREAHINDLMKTGNGADVARQLDTQAKAVLGAQKPSVRMFEHYPSQAVKSTPTLAEPQRAFAIRGGPAKIVGIMGSAERARQSTGSLQRTMSVQTRKQPPAVVKPARPASFAVMDDDYDPFNYAVYPSRSSMYSNPPEAPAMTSEVEAAEDEVMPVIEADAAAGETEEPEEAGEVFVAQVAVQRSPVEVAVQGSPVEATMPGKIAVREEPKEAEETTTSTESKVEPPKPAAAAPASGWAARFQPQGGPQKVEALLKSAGIAQKTAPDAADDKDESPKAEKPAQQVKAEPAARKDLTKDLKAKEETKAEPEFAPAQSKLPIRGGPQKAMAVLASAAAAREATNSLETTTPATEKEPEERPQGPQPTELPRSSLPMRKVSRPVTPPTRQTPASLLLAGGSVKIASPCSSPKSPKKEFSAAALPRFGTA